MSTSKVCSKCQKSKESTSFSPRKDRPIGLYSCCKDCKANSRSRRYRERRVEDPIALWVVNARNWSKDRSKRKGIVFDLSNESVVAALALSENRCTYCSIPFNFQRTIQTRRDSPTLDRIVPSLGYTPQNVVVCCYRCNMIKNEATPEELRRLSDTVSRLLVERILIPNLRDCTSSSSMYAQKYDLSPDRPECE